MSEWGRWYGIKMPSEVADGRPSGAEAGPVITYHLSDEELERYRQGDHQQGVTSMSKLDKQALYARFAAGEGADWQSRKAMAEEFGCDPSTLLYHYRRWEKAGHPGAAPESLPEESREEQPSTREEQAEASTAETQPVDRQAEQPLVQTAMAEALMRAGVTITPESETQPDPEPVAVRWPTVGEVYEGQVERVDRGFALVNLLGWMEPGRDRPLRGRILAREVLRRGRCDDVRRYLAPGDLVNVRVLSLEPVSNNGRPRIELSSRQAPAHSQERVPLQEEPITARGSDIAALMAEEQETGHAPAEEASREAEPPAQPEREAPQEQEQEPSVTAAPAAQADGALGICATCLHHIDQFCPYPDLLEQTYKLTDDDLPERHRGHRIVFGRRPVTHCDLYRGEMAHGVV